MKIFYQRSYSIAPYLTERIGFEIDADVDGLLNPDLAIAFTKDLKELCDKAHKSLNPNIEEMQGTVITPVETRTSEEITTDQQVQGYYQIIELAKTHQQLSRHQGNIEKLGNEKLTNTFHEKLQSLQK